MKSSMSENLFNQFKSTYQSISPENSTEKPYVYVDPDGSIKLLTSVVENGLSAEGIFAVSVAEDGWMEYLAVQNT